MILGAAAVAAVALVAPAAQPAAGAALGRVEIPRLGLSAPLYQGTTATVLARGPGHYSGTALPGERRTIGIAGHRTTHTRPFARINRLRAGDRLTITTTAVHAYRVYRMAIVRPRQVWPLRPMQVEQVVLTACHPPLRDRYRLVVFARRIDEGR